MHCILSQSLLIGQRDKRTNLPRWLKWLPKLKRKLYHRRLVHILYLSLALLFLSPFSLFKKKKNYDSVFILGVDAGTKGPEPTIAEEAKGPIPSVQTIEA